MKVILTEKINKLGNIGDAVEVKTGFARNFLLPNGKAMRWTRENVALFEAKKAELIAREAAAKKEAEATVAEALTRQLKRPSDLMPTAGHVRFRRACLVFYNCETK